MTAPFLHLDQSTAAVSCVVCGNAGCGGCGHWLDRDAHFVCLKMQQYPARYTLMVRRWREGFGDQLPAGNHLGTGGVQLLRREWNHRYYALLESFSSETGASLRMNTRFNVRGEPIVSSPKDALYIGNFRLGKGTV